MKSYERFLLWTVVILVMIPVGKMVYDYVVAYQNKNLPKGSAETTLPKG